MGSIGPLSSTPALCSRTDIGNQTVEVFPREDREGAGEERRRLTDVEQGKDKGPRGN